MLIIMIKRPLILITNDDGIDSPGIHAAIEALYPIANLIIAAPIRQQSGTGRSLRAEPDAVFQERTIKIGSENIQAHCLDASPATTVLHALQCLCQEQIPDMLVSGINFGENLGTNITASGTIGAAIQSAAWNIKSMAVSLEVPPVFHFQHGKVDWRTAICILRKAAKLYIARTWPDDVHIIKIDIPECATENTAWQLCRQSLEPGWWGQVPDASPQSPADIAIGMKGPRPGKTWKEGDDMSVLLGKREVAITPISIDMTSNAPLSEMKRVFLHSSDRCGPIHRQ